MRFLATAFVLLASVSTVDAQSVVDTLDNRRYFPLEVGNEWQYTTIAFLTPIPSWTRVRIMGDTLVDDKRYFKRLTEHFGENENARVDWLRYNDVGAVLSFDEIEAETADRDSITYWYHADFGDTLRSDLGDVYIGGGYEKAIYLDDTVEVDVAAVKILNVPDPLGGTSYYASELYAADFGRVAWSVFDGPYTHLSYARIGGIEYGTAPITVGGEREDAPHRKRLAVYPNPARQMVTIEFEPSPRAELQLCDLLGRCIGSAEPRELGVGGILQLDVSALSAGAYLIMLARDAGSHETAVLTVVR